MGSVSIAQAQRESYLHDVNGQLQGGFSISASLLGSLHVHIHTILCTLLELIDFLLR